MSLLLEGKRAFLTGGTRGIGAALCEVFAREGADVAFSYNSRDDLAAEMTGKIEAHGRRAHAFKVSITDRFGMKHLTRELVQEWGGVDILVNNAAINRGDNFAVTTDRAWDEVINTNVGSLFAVTKPIYKQMIRQRAGSILNITSIGAIRALPTSVHYATSKAAMIGFTKCLSREAGTFGIRVNAIAAGIFDTDLAQTLPERWLQMHEFWASSGRLGRPEELAEYADLAQTLPERWLQMHEFWASSGRLGRPEELAEYAAFMVSDRNSFMNGEVVIVDGGAVT